MSRRNARPPDQHLSFAARSRGAPANGTDEAPSGTLLNLRPPEKLCPTCDKPYKARAMPDPGATPVVIPRCAAQNASVVMSWGCSTGRDSLARQTLTATGDGARASTAATGDVPPSSPPGRARSGRSAAGRVFQGSHPRVVRAEGLKPPVKGGRLPG